MRTNPTLTALGRRTPRDGLAHQARLSVALAREHASQLASHGWSAEQTERLERQVLDFERHVAGQSEVRERTRIARTDVSRVVQAATTFLQKLAGAAKLAAPRLDPAGVNLRALRPQSPLRGSPARLAAHLARIRPLVEAGDMLLRVYFAGQSPLAELDQLKLRLDRTETDHQLARVAMPDASSTLTEAKGTLLQELRTLEGIARLAFHDQPGVAGTFRLALLPSRRRASPPVIPPLIPPSGPPAPPAPVVPGPGGQP